MTHQPLTAAQVQAAEQRAQQATADSRQRRQQRLARRAATLTAVTHSAPAQGGG